MEDTKYFVYIAYRREKENQEIIGETALSHKDSISATQTLPTHTHLELAVKDSFILLTKKLSLSPTQSFFSSKITMAVFNSMICTLVKMLMYTKE